MLIVYCCHVFSVDLLLFEPYFVEFYHWSSVPLLLVSTKGMALPVETIARPLRDSAVRCLFKSDSVEDEIPAKQEYKYFDKDSDFDSFMPPESFLHEDFLAVEKKKKTTEKNDDCAKTQLDSQEPNSAQKSDGSLWDESQRTPGTGWFGIKPSPTPTKVKEDCGVSKYKVFQKDIIHDLKLKIFRTHHVPLEMSMWTMLQQTRNVIRQRMMRCLSIFVVFPGMTLQMILQRKLFLMMRMLLCFLHLFFLAVSFCFIRYVSFRIELN